MKKCTLLIFIFSISLLMAESVSFETSIGNFKMTVEPSNSSDITNSDIDIAEEIAKRVEYFETKYFTKLNKLDQKRASKIANEIYELLALLPTEISLNIDTSNNNYNSNTASVDMNVSVNIDENEPKTVEVEEEVVSNNAMSDSNFRTLLQNIQDEAFADDQLSVLKMAVNRSYFTIEQTIQVVNIFSFAEDKVEAVRLMAPKIIDLENAHNLLNAFTFSDDKKAVQSIINNY